MSYHNDNKKSFNLPAYINIPLFLYQDDRLEKSCLLIASFFYSLHTAGKKIIASKDYLCALTGIGKSQYFETLNHLENYGYIKRSGFTNRKKIEWVYSPKSEIIVDESATSPANRTSVTKLNTSPANRTKLVRPTGLNLSGQPDTYNKDNNKDNKKLTNCENPSSSSFFFSETLDQNLLNQKLQNDERSEQLFMEHIVHHVDNNSDKKHSRVIRAQAALKLIKKLKEQNIIFESSGFINPKKVETDQERIARQIEENRQAKIKRGHYYGPTKQEKQVMDYLGIAN